MSILTRISSSFLFGLKFCTKLILRFVWSILWKIVIIAAITYIAIFFEKKLNSSIPLYICAAVDLFGLVLTAQVAIKKDIHKYLSKEDTAK